jgi:DNA-binding response OmpR family regulator
VANPREIERLTAAGADEFIKKPFDVEAVVERFAGPMQS